jgi:hypothetical protein
MTPATVEKSQTAILSRLPILSEERLSPEVVEFLLDMELAPQDHDRLNELAEKARRGTLNVEEASEIEEYRRAGRVVEVFKLKARLALDRCLD